jgi:hypothetical protein
MSACRVGFMLVCFALGACGSGAADEVRGRSGGAKSLGFVLASYDYLYHREPGNTQCPDGFVYTNRDNWEAQFPTLAARRKHLARCKDLQNRGPACENVWFSPEVIADPLPFREVRGRIAHGLDLDGQQPAGASCPHEEFVSPDGGRGIDNQYYRFIGCDKALTAFADEPVRRSIAQNLIYRLLLEIRGVDDESNDPSVDVTIFRGRDPLVLDAAGKAVPWQSQRVDDSVPPEFIQHLRGRIVAGTLITDPSDVLWEDRQWERRLLIRGMSLRLKLTPEGAEGLRTGYVDVAQAWESYAHFAATAGTVFGASAPSAYAALHRLADGYRDPRTNACTALSSARRFEFVRAILIHSPQERAQ